MEKKECYAPLKSFFVYLCVGLCLESIVHIRHFYFLSKLKELFPQRNCNLGNPVYPYTLPHKLVKQLHTANENTNKRQLD